MHSKVIHDPVHVHGILVLHLVDKTVDGNECARPPNPGTGREEKPARCWGYRGSHTSVRVSRSPPSPALEGTAQGHSTLAQVKPQQVALHELGPGAQSPTVPLGSNATNKTLG